ncbi:uncharacterized protein LOC129913559 [Episyrphus balteatus]|uniref:uncharacterized protein LOC129913559 n=1 Tax=Episyrphus balteatus TaxID=286459 RepID=UPI002485B4DC|nr:uncharacterized protein LOC129913559 [Episyrphus balteatus]
MSSSFIQIKPMGMLPFYHNSRTLISSSPEYPQQQARERASRNLFGSPERGAINQMYRQEEKQRCQQFQQRYSLLIDDLDELPLIPKQSQPKLTIKPRPTIPTNTTTIVVVSNATTKKNLTAECRLSGAGESLIEKELREYEMKLKQQQQRKKNCNEKLAAGDRIKSRSNLKLEENNAAATATRTTFVDSSKCANGNGSSGGHGERPKPYARQLQSSMTDYYAQRKTVVCNNNRTASEIPSIEVEATQVLSHLLDDQSVEVESSANTKTASESLSSSLCSSPSSLSSILPCTEESPSQEHYTTRVTTDVVSAEQLA